MRVVPRTRLKFAKGWVSVTAGDGSVLLERVDGAAAPAATKKSGWFGGSVTTQAICHCVRCVDLC